MIEEKNNTRAEELKTQWHPAFCVALRLELKEMVDIIRRKSKTRGD